MSKIVNLAKGRTYSCTCSTDTTITMGEGEGEVTVTIKAPQGLFVATADSAIVDNDAAVIRQLFYASVVAGSGAGGGGGTADMAEEFDPTDDTLAVSGALVAYAVNDYYDLFAQETGTKAMLASLSES